MARKRVFTGAPWENEVSYCRALRSGAHAWVTGTVALGPDGNVVGMGDPYRQALRALEIIGESLERLGMSIEDVVRTRMYVTDIESWKEIGRAHGEVFRNAPPTTTMVEVSALIRPEFLVEIEADAFVESD